MAIDYTAWNPMNIMFGILSPAIATLITLLVNRVREINPLFMEELILLVILLSFYLFMFIYRQAYYNNKDPVTKIGKLIDLKLEEAMK